MVNKKSRVNRFAGLLGLSLGAVMVILTGCVPVPAPLPDRITPAVQSQSVDPASLLQDRHGIRVTRLGLTNVNSAVDFQYMVTDVDKAMAWLHDEELMPTLVDEDSGMQMHHPPSMMHMPNPKVGRVYHMLMPNMGNAVKRGDRVSVVIGDLQLGPIIAQ